MLDRLLEILGIKGNRLDTEKYAPRRRSLREMRNVVLPGTHNIEEFLHGYCDLFLVYFLERNPEWHEVILVRNVSKRIIHAYASRTLEDGTVLNADARGIYADPKLFLKPYNFREGKYYIKGFSEEELDASRTRIQELDLMPAIEAVYEMAFSECAE